jgi:TetR/AcrR family transcriptional regulator, cholesterol catabolism regulator
MGMRTSDGDRELPPSIEERPRAGERRTEPRDPQASKRAVPRASAEEKRERILSTAARLFYEGGYRATSMESIAEELGVTKPFLYYHFENKHEILEEIARRMMLLARSVLSSAQETEAESDALARFVRGYTRIARAHKPQLMVLFREVSSFSASTRSLLAQEERAHLAQLAELLASATRAGVFQVAQPSLTAAAILSVVSSGELFGAALDLASEELIEQHHVAVALRMAGAAG